MCWIGRISPGLLHDFKQKDLRTLVGGKHAFFPEALCSCCFSAALLAVALVYPSFGIPADNSHNPRPLLHRTGDLNPKKCVGSIREKAGELLTYE